MTEQAPDNELDGASIPELMDFMRSDHPGERAGAACAIGDRLRTKEIDAIHPQTQEALATLLDDPETHVRFETAIAMAELHDFRATPLLLGATRSKALRLDAVRALGTMGDEQAIGPLRQILRKFLMPWADKLQAAAALCALGDPEGQEYLRTKLKSRKFAERAAAIHFMAESRHPNATRDLINILSDLNDPMQDVAARSLGLIPSPRRSRPSREGRSGASGHFAEDIDEAIKRHG